MKRITSIISIVVGSIFLLANSECKRTGCKGVYHIKYQNYDKKDSIVSDLSKGLGLIDVLLAKASNLNLGDNNSPNDTINYFKRYKNSVATYSNKTPEQIVSSYNARINDFCFRTQELLAITKNKKHTESFRKRAEDEYFVLLADYREFLDILDNRIDVKGQVESIVKKK
ncbi:MULTISPECIES: hypothetical protein [Flavobacteriaceae]|uniref:hypothetical protein n=1 Tax=Flavobacteriaceae TaxID=49546 RepID=UPI0014929B52|nr:MULTISPECIES: hypothetical protein [Allomuricauda]MDC6364703.1 hypothetical protein [Muricauda sp. AC10]